MGVNQPLVGVFTIPIGDLIFELKNERKRESAEIKNIIDEIEKITKEEGIPTYGIQTVLNEGGTKASGSPPDRSAINYETRPSSLIEKARNYLPSSSPNQKGNLLKPDDESKKPLLLSIEEEVKEDEEKLRRVTVMP